MNDDFSRQLRAMVDEAVPERPVDGLTGLRVARRRAQRHRARGVALSVAASVVVGAAALGAVTTLEPRPVVPASTASPAPRDTVDLQPAAGVRQMPSWARTYVRHDGATVVDTSLDSWAPGERFFLALTPAGPGLEGPPRFAVYSGTDDDLSALIEADALPEPVWETFAGGPRVLVSGDGRHALAFGPRDGGSSRLVTWDPMTDSEGRRIFSYPLEAAGPLTWGTHGHSETNVRVWASRVDGIDGARAPAVRGTVQHSGGFAQIGAAACTDGDCVRVWDGGTASPGEPARPGPVDLAVAAALADVEEVTGPDGLGLCLALREERRDDEGVDSTVTGRQAQCVADVVAESVRRVPRPAEGGAQGG
ncbi:hypothetical protein DNL40_07835 [Xylanimonas oleitrophica]|uniref:Uncharacterized protein n=1 Tax=Xylanimonas oleitrophica TaxID=2607479 RepID=A0A2W5WS00_9MICO|nr:hypothetical protein [Xylanimonas oleitrophica]PZR53413.1 hypothetical protein DNL40_07835 [Xylanimonas oleitrophica]